MPLPTPNTFRFGQGQFVHKLGDDNCPACRWDVPRQCEKCGEGLVHIELTNKNKGKVFLEYCDICAGRGKGWRNGEKSK